MQHEPAGVVLVHQRDVVGRDHDRGARTCSARRTAAAAAAPGSGSTLPVGSSASRSCGRAITARAIAARCFSPPESTGGSADMRSPSPTQRSSSTTSSRIAVFVAAEHAQRQRHVLVGGHVIEQAEILEHDADAPAQRGERVLAERGDVVAEQRDQAAGRPHRQEQQPQQRDLPAPDGPVRNWNECGSMRKLRSRRTSGPRP